MPKMTWTRPMTEVQQFAANEYVAACGDTEFGAYLFECDAPKGTLYYFEDIYKWEGVQVPLGTCTPCGKPHVADKADTFANGFIDYNNNAKLDAGEEVIVWLERGLGGIPHPVLGGNAHATTNLNRESWEVTKS